MTATALDSRQAKIDEYVGHSGHGDFLWHALFIAAEECDAAYAAQDNTSALESPLFDELWPDDDDTDREHQAADQRSAWLTADLLMALTTAEGQDRLKAEAMRLSRWTAPSSAEE